MPGQSNYDIIVIGAGHAGCEAALSAARMGAHTLLLTMSADTIAKMSCNPAIGGLGKGHIVREIDALGGEMAKATDATALQFRMLNTKKGPAVWSPRAQSDRFAYNFYMKKTVISQANLEVAEDMAEEILIKNDAAEGIKSKKGQVFYAKAIIVCSGTFLNGLIHIGGDSYQAGRIGEDPSCGLSGSLSRLGFEIGRLKTGTSPRIKRDSVEFASLIPQHGDEPPKPFSFSTKGLALEQMPCYITYTNENTHEIIRRNLHLSPLYGGKIKGIGPRYCPSIEDKVVRFKDRIRHQLFLEPETRLTEHKNKSSAGQARDGDQIYINGLSTSLPKDVQLEILHSIKGLENAEVAQFGYAIEYDFSPPTQLKSTLETKLIKNLYFAGQINGTSGYEEAACQGLIAGINSVLALRGKAPLVLRRDEAYIGVLVDDLVTKGTQEPYRMFTSRAEHRLIMRQDNADLRLMDYGHSFGLISDAQYSALVKKRSGITSELERFTSVRLNGSTLKELLKRPENSYKDIAGENGIDEEIINQVEIEIKYEGYMKRELAHIEKMRKLEAKRIPDTVLYESIKGLRKEAVEKFKRIKPLSLGQAARIPGISPSDISILMISLR